MPWVGGHRATAGQLLCSNPRSWCTMSQKLMKFEWCSALETFYLVETTNKEQSDKKKKKLLFIKVNVTNTSKRTWILILLRNKRIYKGTMTFWFWGLLFTYLNSSTFEMLLSALWQRWSAVATCTRWMWILPGPISLSKTTVLFPTAIRGQPALGEDLHVCYYKAEANQAAFLLVKITGTCLLLSSWFLLFSGTNQYSSPEAMIFGSLELLNPNVSKLE